MDYFKENRVVLVGVGRWGRNHLETLVRLLPKGSLGIYEPDNTARAEAAKKAPAAQTYDTYETILKDDNVAAVVIATPANLHFPLALEAVRSGKHVFVEKPLAMKAEEGKSLLEEADFRGVTLAVGHILLFDQAYVKLKQTVERGSLGEVYYVYAERAKLGTVRTAEDVLFSLASHDIAMILDLLERRPTKVSCVGTCGLNETIMDAAVVDIVFEDGVRAHVFASWLHPVVSRRMTVVGSKASAVWDESADSGLRLYKKGAKLLKSGPKLFDRGEKKVKVIKKDKLEAELRDFLESVKSGETPRCDGRGGLAVLRVLSAAQSSAVSDGKPIILEPGCLVVAENAGDE
ncbi:MAG: Gfo/Idh/MocA family oxidoreductase [Candidatus Coatesbacteria bacterium]|nr:MAG: Gfo/Idh/MocA family oxidoreductase [Candidatus Coatesbacteria bacterium]